MGRVIWIGGNVTRCLFALTVLVALAACSDQKQLWRESEIRSIAEDIADQSRVYPDEMSDPRVSELTSRIDELEAENEHLEARLSNLQAQIDLISAY
jgi:ubiquinone biosynthesis protein UbiJ